MAASGRILAIDYGTKKIGLAISDPLQITAAPYKTIRYQSRDEFLVKVREIIVDRDVVKIVVGMPIGLSGNDTKFTQHVREFVEWLRSEISVPIFTLDERFSSEEAKASLIQMGIKTGHNKELVDAMAAAHLLRYYLDIQDEQTQTDS